MATKQTKPKASSLTTSFSDCILNLGRVFPLFQVFDDFLTMAICCCSINPVTKLSHYEEEYLATISKYKSSELRHGFPKAFASLVMEMEANVTNNLGNDVLGTFFELHLSNDRNGQFFTPFHICMFMASCMNTDGQTIDGSPQRILDPACGSGRLLMASHKVHSKGRKEYYGIDIDRVCVKITALNLFLNGMFGSEVMCANALSPHDFVISYLISLLPFGIFKITDKEKSPLWQMHTNSFPKKEKLSDSIVLGSTQITGTQLDLF